MIYVCMFDQAWYKAKKEKNEDEMIHELILLRKKIQEERLLLYFQLKIIFWQVDDY